MKGKSKYLVLLLLVLCGGMVTYALFRTNKSGNANVNAARWNVVFKNGETEIEDSFNISLNNATWTNPLGSVASGKIAPGSSATFYITIDASNTETSVDYTAEIEDSFNETDFDVTLVDDSGTIPYSTTSGAMVKQIPITVVWNGNINDSNTKNNDDLLKKARDIKIPVTITAAQKLALKYTVTFNDGNGNAISSRKVNEGEAVGILPSNPTRLGYTFAGWYDNPTNGNQVTAETLVNQGMNIYAHWDIKYVTVTFDSNGGGNVNPVQVQEGNTMEQIPATSKGGSEFLGWYDSNELLLTTSTIIMENITYTARWFSAYEHTSNIVYYDPKTTNTCNSTEFNLTNVNNGTSTCYKWRIISEDETNATIQLDHNLVNTVAWNSVGNVSNGPSTIMSSLANSTVSWTRVNPLDGFVYDTTDSTYNYGILTCDEGICKINGTTTIAGSSEVPVRARLLTMEEAAIIAGNSNWSMSNQIDVSFSSAKWLLENTREENSGATANLYGGANYGYWLLTPKRINNGHDALVVHAYGSNSYSGNSNIGGTGFYGARPVITVPKSDLN